MAILVDTCALIFITSEDRSSRQAQQAIDDAYARGESLYISPISAWEIGQLVSKRRISLPRPASVWFASAIERSNLAFAPLTPRILLESSFLPDSPLRDPADRIIAATAREFDYTVLTRDRLLLRYAEQGHLRAIAC